MQLGFSLSSEEHRPNALVEQARRAEEAGFSFALISDNVSRASLEGALEVRHLCEDRP